MTEDASLDEFANLDGEDGNESATSSADGEREDGSAATSADGDDGSESTAANADGDPDSAEATVDVDEPEPVASTLRWSPDGGECDACGDSAERRWRDEGALVCASCKEW